MGFRFDVQGPHFLFAFFRMLMLLTAVHAAMLVFRFAKFMLEIHPVILVVTTAPIAIMSMWTFSMIAAMLMQVDTWQCQLTTSQQLCNPETYKIIVPVAIMPVWTFMIAATHHTVRTAHARAQLHVS